MYLLLHKDFDIIDELVRDLLYFEERVGVLLFEVTVHSPALLGEPTHGRLHCRTFVKASLLLESAHPRLSCVPYRGGCYAKSNEGPNQADDNFNYRPEKPHVIRDKESRGPTPLVETETTADLALIPSLY